MILVLNAGSSTLKYALYDGGTAVAGGNLEVDGDYRRAVARAIGEAFTHTPSIDAVGQRVVHGGTRYLRSVRIDGAVIAELERLTDLAPLHNPPALASIAAATAALPGVPQVAVFDTAYYATLAETQFVFPVPYEWYSDWGIRRFGFHGISHAYCAGRAAELLAREELRVVSCHLGNGCSATASRNGKAVATTMGFTPLDGLMMGTRPGAVDPGILLYVARRHGRSPEELERVLNHESGLKGISGVSSDYRRVSEAARSGHRRARLALDLYAERVRAAIGALAVTLGGVDALLFTAGVGEHAAELRAAACTGLECLGVRIDPTRNQGARADCNIASAESTSAVLVLKTREEWMIAREARRVLADG